MNRSRLQLSKLCCRGEGVPDASINFKQGLNVITGPSNTGKSYIFQCIDFMLGGGKVPKTIKQSAGYQQVLLEVLDDQSIWTLVRGLTGGAAQLYESSFDSLSPKTVVAKTLSEKHGKRGESISEFFLDKMGFPSTTKVRFDKYNDTKSLSLRHIAHLFCVNETSIQIEGSPILQGVVNDETVLESAFRYLLTGQDDKGLVSSPRPAQMTTRIKAKEEVFVELLDKAQAELISLEIKMQAVPDQSVIKADIARVTSAIEEFAKKMELLGKTKAEHLEKLAKLESKVIALNELILRFNLLKEHYNSDLNRLIFISEGAHLMEQLEITNCPTCGQTMHQNPDSDLPNIVLDQDIELACESEALKIRALLADLDSTFKNLALEKAAIVADCQALERELDTIEKELLSELTPRLNLEKSKLRALFEMQEISTRRLISKDKISTLRTSLAGVKKKEREELPEVIINVATNPIKASTYKAGLLSLCKEIEGVLHAWDYDDGVRVEFDSEVLDFIVDGEPRQSNGKGRRAFLHAAFNLGLLEYCRRAERGYPNFLVLDSPLTTLKEGKASDDDEVPGSMQDSFFRNLALRNQLQTIVLENKEPPADLYEACNLIQFTRNDTGRYGFFV